MRITATTKTKIILMVILIIIGSVMITAATYEIRMAVDAHSWDKRAAEVIKSELSYRSGDDGGWYASIRCVFKDSGKEFPLRRMAYAGINDGGSGKGGARNQVRDYPVGKTFFVYVCPDDEAKIIVRQRYSFPEMRVIQSVGAGSIVFAFSLLFLVKTKRPDEKKSPAEKERQDQPWLRKKKWADGRIKCMSNVTIWVIGVFALVWNAVSWGVVLSAWDQVFDPAAKKGLAALIFPAVGLLLIVAWIYQIARHLKFGSSFFQMASVPGVIGGRLEGVVYVSKHIEPRDGFKVTFTCSKRVTSGSGENSSTHTHVMHQEEMVIARELLETDYSQSVIPVLFAVPFSPSLQSGSPEPKTTISWILTVTADLPGTDYNARFEVPVFLTEESSQDFKLDTSALEGYLKKMTPDELLREQRISHRTDMDREIFFFPMFRTLGTGLGLSFFSAGFSGAAVFLLKEGPWPMAIIFGLVGWFIFMWAMDVLFWSCRAEMQRDGIKLNYGLCRLNRVKLPYEAVDDVVIKRGMQSGETLYHSVIFKIKDGRKSEIPVGKRIRNRQVAQKLVDMYQNSLLQEGKTFSSGREFTRAGQHWSLWKQRVLVWGLFVASSLAFVSLKVAPTTLINQMNMLGSKMSMDQNGDKLRIKAFIDDRDFLKIRGSELWYEHISGSLPGKWAKNNHVTHINGKEWMPKWNKKVSDPFKNLTPGLPVKEHVNVKVLKVENGQAVVVEQPSLENEYTLTLKLEELAGGAHWMELTIGW